MTEDDAWLAYCTRCARVPTPPKPRDTFAAGWMAARRGPVTAEEIREGVRVIGLSDHWQLVADPFCNDLAAALNRAKQQQPS